MNKRRAVTIVALITVIITLGFMPWWPHTSLFGTSRINSFEFFGHCWQGDVRVCDYDPLE